MRLLFPRQKIFATSLVVVPQISKEFITTSFETFSYALTAHWFITTSFETFFQALITHWTSI